MCGIFGSANITPDVTKMLPFLAVEMESRGKDSWGASDGITIVKQLGKITKSWGKAQPTLAQWNDGRAAIYHTRASSVGSSTLENAHPFEFTSPATGTRIVGIHNGHLYNHSALNSKYNRKFAVDSMHIWANRAEGLGWADLDGWGNLAWFEIPARDGATPQLHLTRFNNTALYVAQVEDGGYVFASTPDAIELASEMAGADISSFYTVEEFYEHYFAVSEDGKLTFYQGEKLDFAPKAPASTQYVSGGTTYTSANRNGTRGVVWNGAAGARGSGSSSSYIYTGDDLVDIPERDVSLCVLCGTRPLSSMDDLLCDRCYVELYVGYRADRQGVAA